MFKNYLQYSWNCERMFNFNFDTGTKGSNRQSALQRKEKFYTQA